MNCVCYLRNFLNVFFQVSAHSGQWVNMTYRRNTFLHLCIIFWGASKVVSGKESTCKCRRLKRHRFSLWVGKIPGKRSCNPFQYSCLDNSTDKRACRATDYGVTKKRTRFKDWACTHTLFYLFLLEYSCFTMLCFSYTQWISYTYTYVVAVV